MTANQVQVTEGTGKSVGTETVGTVDYQRVEIVGAGGSSVLSVAPDGSIKASIIGVLSVTGSVFGFQGGSRTISGSVLAVFAPVASLVSGVTSIMTLTSASSLLAAAPGAQRNYVSQILVTNAAAVGTFVDIMDGANVIYSGYAAASGGGWSATFQTPLKQPTSSAVLETKARTQASVIVSATGYTGA